MTKIKNITARRLGPIYQLEIDETKVIVLYESGVRKLAELIGKLTGVEPQLEPRKKAAKPPKAAKPAKVKAAKVKKGKGRPVETTEESEQAEPPRIVAEQV